MSYYENLYGPAIYDRFMDDGRQSAQFLVESIQRYVTPGMKVLDVGAGTGFVAFSLAPLLDGGQIVGIDADDNALVLAKYKAQKRTTSNITFQKGDALELDFAEGSFDMVLANQIPLDQEKVIGEMVRVTRPGGIVGIARPHPPRSQLFQFVYDIACEIAIQRDKKPPERLVHMRSDPGVIQGVFDQVGLEVLMMEEKGFFDDDLDRSLLASLIQPIFPFLVSYAGQIDENDRTAMVQGYMDFLEVREKVFDEKYNRNLELFCLIAIGRKPRNLGI